MLIPLLLGPYVLSLSNETKDTLTAIDYLIWGVFAANLVVKLAITPRRLTYLQRPWFDVLLIALPLLDPLRVAWSLRSLRALQAFAAGFRVVVVGRRLLTRHGLHYVVALVHPC